MVLDKLSEKLQENRSVVIHRISSDEAEQRSFYRVLHNHRVGFAELAEYVKGDCRRQVEPGVDYVLPQDTTQPNFKRNAGNIVHGSGLGVIGDNESPGFFAHVTLAMETGTGRAIGFPDVHCWKREVTVRSGPGAKPKGSHKDKAFADKESARWLNSTVAAAKEMRAAGADGLLTFIFDREGDIHEVFAADLGDSVHVLVRARGDRPVVEPATGKALNIKEYMAKLEASVYELEVKGEPRQNRKGRVARMELRHSRIKLAFPKRLGGPAGGTITMWAVWVKETAGSTPGGEKPVEWLLLTDREVTGTAAATRVVEDYALRWNVEQVFRLVKQQGLDIEDSDLEQGYSLIKLFMLSLVATYQVVALHRASQQDEVSPIKQMFTGDEVECLGALNEKHEGKTEKQKNPFPPGTLQWAYWVIGRMGGWKPHEKRAGVITLHRGWVRFKKVYEGWTLARARDVS